MIGLFSDFDSFYNFLISKEIKLTVSELDEIVNKNGHLILSQAANPDRVRILQIQLTNLPVRIKDKFSNSEGDELAHKVMNMILAGEKQQDLPARIAEKPTDVTAWYLEKIKQLLVEGVDVNLPDIAGQTPLRSAAQLGELEIVESLIAAGADLNLQDEKGFTALMWAADKGHLKIVEALIAAGADLHRQDKNGLTALMVAAFHGHLKIVGALIAVGVDLNQQDKQGWPALMFAVKNGHLEIVRCLLDRKADVNKFFQEETVLTLLKCHQPHHKLMRQLIKMHASREMCDYSKFYTYTKLISHTFQFKGKSIFSGREFSWEGSYVSMAPKAISKSIPSFAQEFPLLLSEKTAHHLTESLQFTADQWQHTAPDILDRIRKGEPTFIISGYNGHGTTILVWGDLFVLCNRISQKQLEVHRFDCEKLGMTALRLLLFDNNRSKQVYDSDMAAILPVILNFSQTDNEQKIESAVSLPEQIVGNCGWASLEGAMKAFLLLDKLKEHSFKIPSEKIEELKDSVEVTHANWLSFQQLLLLDKYLAVKHDPQLIEKCFEELWIKSGKSRTFAHPLKQRLETLEAKALANRSYQEALMFRTKKIWTSHQEGFLARTLGSPVLTVGLLTLLALTLKYR